MSDLSKIKEFKIKQINEEKEIALKNSDFILAKNLHRLTEELMDENIKSKDETSDSVPTISEIAVKEIINEMTGIPIVGIGKRINKNDLFDSLSKRVMGQDKAVKAVASSIVRGECGIAPHDRPKGFYMFIGASGVGKTELARAIAEALFFDKNAFLKFDMSEYSEPNSVTKLIGSPPGYSGHDEGGALTEKVRRHPYSIILFDEIEKAHPEVLDLFLQIADTGTLTDSSGRSVSFKNCYVILTSNVRAGFSSDSSIGFGRNNSEDEQRNIREELTKHFRPEFINRIDEIIPFSPVDIHSMNKIADKKLSELTSRLEAIGYYLEYDDEVLNYIAEEGVNSKFGVRNLLRIIAREIEAPISSLLSEENLPEDLHITLTIKAGKITANAKEKLFLQ